MEWDKIKIAQSFLAKANALHPEEEYDADERVKMQALQDLYYECYMSSFSKEKLGGHLDQAIKGDVKIPDEVDEQKYKTAYSRHAEKIKLDLLS
jgi:hypothetical protein